MAVCPVNATLPAEPGIDQERLTQLTPCDDQALEQLAADFEARKPASIVIGKGRARTRKVIDRFLSSRSEQTCRIRISGSCTSADSCLKQIVEEIGFGTRDLNQRDLDNILKMFLSFQRTHRRRTIICIEGAEKCGSGVLGKLFEFIDIESEENFGLFVVIAGHDGLDRRLGRGALAAISNRAGAPIPVLPLAGNETRDFVLDQIEAQNFEDATLVIEPEAIQRMHELSGGVCDTVNGLCDQSIRMAIGTSTFPITIRMIDNAAVELGLLHAEIEASPKAAAPGASANQRPGKLKLFCRGQFHSEFSLDCDVVRIGRHQRNDLCLPSLLVSRYHALLTLGEGGAKLADLGSSNGTIVNGNLVKSRILVNGDTILFGDYRAEFVAADSAINAKVAAEIMALGDSADETERGFPAVKMQQA